MFETKDQQLNTTALVDEIEKAVYTEMKPYGFRKHGRTLHRFVDGDISQVINFQNGCAAKGIFDVLWVNIGIRVPECMLHCFIQTENTKKYYHEYECNMRSRLCEVEGKDESYYDLHDPIGDLRKFCVKVNKCLQSDKTQGMRKNLKGSIFYGKSIERITERISK